MAKNGNDKQRLGNACSNRMHVTRPRWENIVTAVFASDWLKLWSEFFNQSWNVAKRFRHLTENCSVQMCFAVFKFLQRAFDM